MPVSPNATVFQSHPLAIGKCFAALYRATGVIGRGRAVWGCAALVLMIVGCTPQASYMRKWQPAERITNRWSGGTIRADKLSEDETAVFEERGTPDVIRLFRSAQTRERVYEWIYESNSEVVWFVDGQQVDYVVVDTNMLPLTRAQRENLRQKAYAGGIMGGIVGTVATGLILFGEDLGVKD